MDAACCPRAPLLDWAPFPATDLVVEAGYPLEEHFVTTADGYVLGVYRIPGCGGSSASGFGSGRSRGGGTGSSSTRRSGSGRSRGDSAQRRPPVLLLHGVLDSSAAWVLNEPSQSLGFILADAGFDVWLGEGALLIGGRWAALAGQHVVDPGCGPASLCLFPSLV